MVALLEADAIVATIGSVVCLCVLFVVYFHRSIFCVRRASATGWM
jgi:hypothetical protein